MAKKRFADITQANIASQGVQALNDRPARETKYGEAGVSALGLKLWFDKLSKLSAEKINAIHRVLFSDEAAEYIALNFPNNDIESLNDFIKKFVQGTAAEEILKVFPSLNVREQISLQSAIYNLSRTISDLGNGYTDAEAEYVNDGGEVGVDFEIIDYSGGKKLKFIFYNFANYNLEEVYVYKGKMYLVPNMLNFVLDSSGEFYNVDGANGSLRKVLYIYGHHNNLPVKVKSLDISGVTDLILGEGITVLPGAFKNNGDLKWIEIRERAVLGDQRSLVIGSKPPIFDTKTSAYIYIRDDVNIGNYSFYNVIDGSKRIVIGDRVKAKQYSFQGTIADSIKAGKGFTTSGGTFNKITVGSFTVGKLSNVSGCSNSNIDLLEFGDECVIGSFQNGAIKEVNIGNICIINQSCFTGNTVPMKIKIGDQTEIGNSSFRGVPRTSLEIGAGCIIKPYAFQRMNASFGYEYFELPRLLDVISIGTYAFYGNAAPPLTDLIIIQNCNLVGVWAFADCYTDGTDRVLSLEIIGDTTIDIGAFINIDYIGSLSMPNVTHIDIAAFEVNAETNTDTKNNYIMSLNISGCVTIEQEAFAYRDIRKITWSTKLQEIGDDAFLRAILPSIELPQSCRQIGAMAFGLVTFSQDLYINFYCSNCYVKNNAFAGIGSSYLKGVNIKSLEYYLTNQFESAGSCPICDALYLYYENGTEATRMTIPASISTVFDYAFQSCQNLWTVRFPRTVETIGTSAFAIASVEHFMCEWEEGSRAGAPWGANLAIIHYNQ